MLRSISSAHCKGLSNFFYMHKISITKFFYIKIVGIKCDVILSESSDLLLDISENLVKTSLFQKKALKNCLKKN